MTHETPLPSDDAVTRPRLLVVDDEPTSRRALAVLLGAEGYEVDVVASAAAALARVAAAPPDVLLTDVNLSGQGIADALYGLSGMTTDCPELRSLLSALAERIDETQGKLDSQEIGNALYGLQALSSDMTEARLIAGKLAEKLKRSKAVMLSQHIGRAILGFQRLGPDSAEVRALPLFL
jgi:CheY-like chemotaxis protein